MWFFPDENSHSDVDNTGVLIGAPLGVFFALLSVITITVILLAVTRRWIMTSILRLPPPPCECVLCEYIYVHVYVCTSKLIPSSL